MTKKTYYAIEEAGSKWYASVWHTRAEAEAYIAAHPDRKLTIRETK